MADRGIGDEKALSQARLTVDVGVFAHNKAGVIADTLRDLLAQHALAAHDVRIVVLVNGCTDATPLVVADLAHHNPAIVPVFLAKSGKSRAWNSFVHHESRRNCDILIFADADIRLPDRTTLTRLIACLQADDRLHAVNSRPIKDLALLDRRLKPVEKLILASAETANDWRQAICGQLYAMPAARAHEYALPIGLPVEDGFLHALIATEKFDAPPVGFRVDGSEASHVYESERTISALVRHQVRIVIGSAINEAIFRTLEISDQAGRRALLDQAAKSDDWLPVFLSRALPRVPYGYVSIHFLIKRSQRALAHPRALLYPKRLLIFVAGAVFDLLVYLLAQLRMARGVGAGFW